MLRQISTLMIISALLLSVSILGCTSGKSPVIPGNPDTSGTCMAENGPGSHVLWGMVNVTIDPDTFQAEVIPLRGPMFTANVTQFMQPPISPTNMIGLTVDPSSDFETGYVVVDVTLRHPFPALNFYNGFDVRGIFMSDGTDTLDHDSTALYAVTGDSMLLNADGYTKWWNWADFTPYENIFGATYGKLAPPNQPTATLNGYKYFADELESEDPLTVLDPANRGAFTTSGVNTRRYEIQFKMEDTSVVFDFQYAVDASWSDPDPAFDPDYPTEAFPLFANSAEAYLITVTDTGSTAWYVDASNNGGSLLLDIEIYDWQAPNNPSGVLGELAGLWLDGEVVSAPVNLLSGATVVPGGDTSSIIETEIVELDLTGSGPMEIWIIAENADPNTYEPNLDIDTSPWTWAESPLAAYLRTTVNISSEPEYVPEVLAIDPDEGNQNTIVPVTITGNHFADGCQVELRESAGTHVIAADNELWTDETEVTCDLDLDGANLGLYDVVVINPDLLEGSLDEGFEVLAASPPEVTAIDPDEAAINSTSVSATITGDHFDTGCQVELRESGGTSFVVEASGEVCTIETEVTCDLDLTGAPLGFYDVVVINPNTLEGSLDKGFAIFQPNVIYVDDSNTSGVEDGTMHDPYDTIQEGLAAAPVGWEVWVDDSGVDYTGPVTLAADVILKSVNWDNSDGGDMATISGGSPVVVGADDATIDGFEIDGGSRGIDCDGTSPEILNCRVVSCVGSGSRAIGLYNGSHAHLDGVEVYDVRTGGDYRYCYGILVENCDAVGPDTVVIEHTKVHYVRSSGSLGGGYCYPHGIYINNSDGVLVKNTIVYDVTGGNQNFVYGFRIANSDNVELVNDVIYDVQVDYWFWRAYGLYFTGCNNLDVRNTIIDYIHRNIHQTRAYGVYADSVSTYTFDHNNVYNCQDGNYTGSAAQGLFCISANPSFVTPGTDFHLQGGSPCINTGDPTILDPDSSISDMGAYGGPGGDW